MNTSRLYYVYLLRDADGVARYVGKGTGARSGYHGRLAAAILAGEPATRASRVHRRMAAELAIGRSFTVEIVADGLDQPDAYAVEARTIARYRREIDGGPLWNVLAGGEGFQGVPRAEWRVIAQAVADAKRAAGSDKLAAAKAAETKRRQGLRLAA
jgi:hypothetical protein